MSIYDKASLVLIPSGTKTSKVYSQKPTNGDGDFTFSRSTAATRVNASGNIEKETQNLFTYSNTFSNSAWNKNAGGSFTSGQAGYDGSNDAWQFNVTTASNSGTWQNVTFSGVATFSAYFKKGTIDKVGFTNYAGNAYECWFDLTNGTIGQQTGDLIDANIESVGGGWYRCSITDIAVSTNYFQLKPSNAYSGVSTAGYIYIQDAQLEQGLVARDYIETTTTAIYGGITDNVPRLDYTDSSCPALLLEPQRTNVIEYSEYLLDGWSDTGCTITKTNETNPSGNDISYFATAIDSHNADRIRYFNGAKSGDYYFSFFAKGDGNAHQIYLRALGGSGASNMYWDVAADGTISFNSNDSDANGSPISEDYGNGWYRIGFKQTFTGANAYSDIRPSKDDINSGIYIWGVQWEAGSYATSYIPTYGSAVTRNQDDCENTNLDLLSQDAATYFLESTPIAIASNNILEVRGNGNTNDRLLMQTNSSGILRILVRNSGSTILDSNISSAVSAGTKIKVALKYTSTNISVFVDGVKKIDSDLSVNFGSPLDWINLEGTATANNDALEQHQFLFFPTALTDQEAIDLTTL